MTNTKKLGLVLLPLLPLTAIGIVEVANNIMPSQPTAIVAQQEAVSKTKPVTTKPVPPPPPNPAPAPQPPRPAPPK